MSSDNLKCCHCGAKAEGEYSIHDTAEKDGIEFPLCIICGAFDEPTDFEIWDHILSERMKSILSVLRDNSCCDLEDPNDREDIAECIVEKLRAEGVYKP